MKERGILFRPDMIRAIRAGLKTQTRRVITPKPIYGDVGGMFSSWQFTSKTGRILYPNGADEVMKLCPYGQVGDRLWVKETYFHQTLPGAEGKIQYKADGWPEVEQYASLKSIWKSAMFMPKAAARLWLEITGIGVERVQDISGEDAEAEGVKEWAETSGADLTLRDQRLDIYQLAYSHLWDEINAKAGAGWDVNPFVWKITFKVIGGAE